MKKFKYLGPHDAVELVGVGVVERGHQIEVDDPDVSASLEQQEECWQHIPDRKRSAAAKKAAAKRTAAEHEDPAEQEPAAVDEEGADQ